VNFRLQCLKDADKPAQPQVSGTVATATPATTATDRPPKAPSVANVAAVAVAAAALPVVSDRDETTAAREARQAKVEQELQAHPEQKRAFDVADAPLNAGAGASISVVLAVRHGEQILSGELHIPRERWDFTVFIALMESPERQQ
jgi:hypothetical protein